MDSSILFAINSDWSYFKESFKVIVKAIIVPITISVAAHTFRVKDL